MNALIVEDEILIAEQMQRMLYDVAPHVRVLGVVSSLKALQRWLVQHPEPDLIFMDIQLSDGLSFAIFEQFRLRCPVIFTTAYDEYAIRAFRANGIDYLLKPVEEEDLIRSLEKLRRFSGSYEGLVRQIRQEPAFREKFIVHHRQSAVPVSVQDIAVFELDQLIYLHKRDGQRYMMDHRSLEEIEAELNPVQFFRANRRQIVSLDAIERFRTDPSGRVLLTVAPVGTIEISKEKAPVFRKWINR